MNERRSQDLSRAAGVEGGPQVRQCPVAGRRKAYPAERELRGVCRDPRQLQARLSQDLSRVAGIEDYRPTTAGRKAGRRRKRYPAERELRVFASAFGTGARAGRKTYPASRELRGGDFTRVAVQRLIARPIPPRGN